jgi:hypothetical protein
MDKDKKEKLERKIRIQENLAKLKTAIALSKQEEMSPEMISEYTNY